MSPYRLEAAAPLGHALNEFRGQQQDDFVHYMRRLQTSSKRLTPEVDRNGESPPPDKMQSKVSLGLNQQSLKSSGPYNYLEWSKARGTMDNS